MILALRRVLAAVCFVLLCGASAPAPDAAYLSPQQLVDVGGRRLNIYCTGQGSPTVVLDAAIGSSAYVWHNVQSARIAGVRMCSYDRAGYGFSDPGGLPHTSAANVRDLHALLHNAGISPPYVLVAHSLNAFDARLYADEYRKEVAAMVLLDPSETGEDRFGAIYGKASTDAEQRANLQYLRMCDEKAHRHTLRAGDDCVGPNDPRQSKALQRVQLVHKTSPGLWDAVFSEMASLPADVHEVVTHQIAYGNLPLLVLTAGGAEQSGAAPGTSAAQIAAANRLWKQLRTQDAAHSSLGVSCIVPHAQHYLQIDDPMIVIKAIRNVVKAAARATRPACPV